MSYCIFTVCTKNYKEAYRLVIDSWLKTDVDKIFIYTDDILWKSTHPRVEVIHYFEKKSSDWLVNVGRRAYAAKDIIENRGYDRIIFLDIDCYILKDISHVFKSEFDMAVVRFVDGIELSAGVFFINKNEKTKRFADEWIEMQDICQKRGIGVRPYKCSYSQHGYDKLIRGKSERGDWKIKKLSFDEYSLKVKDEDAYRLTLKGQGHSNEEIANKIKEWRDGLKNKIFNKDIKVLHFYGNSFRNSDTITNAFDLIEEKVLGMID